MSRSSGSGEPDEHTQLARRQGFPRNPECERIYFFLAPPDFFGGLPLGGLPTGGGTPNGGGTFLLGGLFTLGGTFPGGTFPGGTFPGGTFPGGTFPGGTFPGGTFPGGTFPGGTFPPFDGGLAVGFFFPGGRLPAGGGLFEAIFANELYSPISSSGTAKTIEANSSSSIGSPNSRNTFERAASDSRRKRLFI
jgi:hypothetical protein